MNLADGRLPGELPPGMRAHLARFRALLSSARGERDAIEPQFKAAEEIFAEFDEAFDLAVARLEHAEWLARQGEADRARELLDQARETFERLRAKPWFARAAKLRLAEAADVSG